MTMENRELAVYKPNMSVAELRTIAADFAKSGYFQDAREAVQAVVKIQAGVELGFGPVYSMTKIYIVKGKVMVSAEAMGAMIKRSGRYDYIVKKLDDTEAVLLFTDNGKEAYTSKFTMEDAKRADLVKGDSGWSKYPRAMLMSKALSQGARIVCPHVIAGAYTPEDFGVETTADGDVKDPPKAPPVVVESTVVPPTEKTEGTPAPAGPEMCTAKQRQKIFATGRQMGYTDDQIRAILTGHYYRSKTEDLTKTEADEFIAAIEAGKTVDESGNWK